MTKQVDCKLMDKADEALLRAIGNAAQEAENLRQAANGPWQDVRELESAVAAFVLAAALVRNRFHEAE